MSAMTMLAHINAVSVPMTAASNAIDAASVFFTVIDAPKPTLDGLCPTEMQLHGDIVIKNVNFAYPTRHEVRVLNNLSLVIPKGKVTAIVGPSGCGKSTIVALIQRWYELGGVDPITNYLRNGSITVNGTSLNEIQLHWWRSRIGFVQQEPVLFRGTVYETNEACLML